MPSRALILSLGLLLLVAGCGRKPVSPETIAPVAGTPSVAATAEPTSGRAATGAPAVIDACGLLPLGDAETLAGTTLDAGVKGSPDMPSCTYTGPPSGPVAQVEIYVGDGAKKFYDIDRELGHRFTPVPGIGDEAFAEENAVFFRKGVTWVALRLVRLNDPAQNVEPLRAAARLVAGRM